MCQRERPRALVTPEQTIAMQYLLNQLQRGQTPYTGDFNITPDDYLRRFMEYSGDLGFDTSGLEELARTGAPFNQEEMFAKQRELAEGAATKALEQKLAEMEKFGAKYSSPAVAAATKEAATVKAQTELGILQQMAQEHAAAQQRRLAASQLLLQGIDAMRSLGVDAARVYVAGKQFEKGMQYEEFKRMYPDVYQLATAIFGRNVDYYIKQRPDYISTVLSIIGLIVAKKVA